MYLNEIRHKHGRGLFDMLTKKRKVEIYFDFSVFIYALRSNGHTCCPMCRTLNHDRVWLWLVQTRASIRLNHLMWMERVQWLNRKKDKKVLTLFEPTRSKYLHIKRVHFSIRTGKLNKKTQTPKKKKVLKYYWAYVTD